MKFQAIIKVEVMKLVCDFKNHNLSDDLIHLFTLNSEINKYHTKNVCNEGLYIPKITTSNFGLNSLKYYAPTLWNSILKNHISLNSFKNHHSLGKYLKKLFISPYNTNQMINCIWSWSTASFFLFFVLFIMKPACFIIVLKYFYL